VACMATHGRGRSAALVGVGGHRGRRPGGHGSFHRRFGPAGDVEAFLEALVVRAPIEEGGPAPVMVVPRRMLAEPDGRLP
jgi:hypothetical protein